MKLGWDKEGSHLIEDLETERSFTWRAGRLVPLPTAVNSACRARLARDGVPGLTHLPVLLGALSKCSGPNEAW